MTARAHAPDTLPRTAYWQLPVIFYVLFQDHLLHLQLNAYGALARVVGLILEQATPNWSIRLVSTRYVF